MSPPLRCSAVTRACFTAYMQHTVEQWLLPLGVVFREPTHWIQAIFLGSVWFEGRTRWPMKGPPAESSRSYSRPVTTSGMWP